MTRGEKRLPISLKRAAFPRLLKWLRPVPTSPIAKAARKEKQAVFINWRRLYWGNLDGLLYRDEGENLSRDGEAEIPDTYGTDGFADELRRELRAFAKDYNLKLIWRQTSKSISMGIPEVTGAFLEYWYRGLSQQGNEAARMPLADLCRLGDQDIRNKTIRTHRSAS